MKQEWYREMLSNGYLTVNEVREMEGLAPIVSSKQPSKFRRLLNWWRAL